MPFYQATGQDHRTRATRTLDISAQNADDATLTAFDHGLIEVKVAPLTDRDLLNKDLACFVYADPLKPKRAHAIPVNANYPPSFFLDHPILTIASGIVLGLSAYTLLETLIARAIQMIG